jgi:hypothetical protein
MRSIFYKLSDAYAKCYSPSEHLAVDEVIVLFKGRVIFILYIPQMHEWFGIKICNVCYSKGYACSFPLYLCKDRKCACATVTATYATVTGLTARTENLGHKLYMDNLFSRLT